ncbi:uncharacterized protein [Physcomitrium patens]|uniref:uncharacterized protein isoform X2 n=1 Tax=Physcomitrium patens TaxID=3218 RepID=UPI000D163C20|nr:uncharacterized protein LOC112276111 isoform X2 [Physcomitrium patens]|eukprot:XP_024362912.1 uncharacterized protein LOC112276111 isoform X2 [Physcomitrella patens]
MDVGSAAALYAGSVLVKKTFEAVAQRSLSSLFTRLNVRFRGQIELQLQLLQKELESRLQYVLHGNTALQGALDMAIRVINDIVSFQEELEAQAYNESIVKTSQADAVARLQGFMTRLDSILPYLSMAVNAVSLLRVADSGLSPSRLMQASHLIRTANDREGTVISFRAKMYKYETKLTLPRWQEKMMRCCVSLKQAVAMPGLGSTEFVLSITNEEESESGDILMCICLPVSHVSAVGSCTLHVLGLGEHELEAVLLVDAVVSSGSVAEIAKDSSASSSLLESNHYAFQCIEGENDAGNEDDARGHDGNPSHDGQESDTLELESTFGSKVYKLGMLEYALRLCMLQMKEEKEHWLLSDERIRLFFEDPRYISEPAGISQKTRSGSVKIPSGFRTPTPRKGDSVRSLNSRTSVGPKVAPRIIGSRSNISELFYDLKLESPGGSGSS